MLGGREGGGGGGAFAPTIDNLQHILTAILSLYNNLVRAHWDNAGLHVALVGFKGDCLMNSLTEQATVCTLTHCHVS